MHDQREPSRYSDTALLMGVSIYFGCKPCYPMIVYDGMDAAHPSAQFAVLCRRRACDHDGGRGAGG